MASLTSVPDTIVLHAASCKEGPPGVFGEQGNTGNLTMGTREQSKKIVGNKGTSNRLENRGTNTKNYKALGFLHKSRGDRKFSDVF